MSFHERLSPRIHKGPFRLGHRLGEEIPVGQNRHFGEDEDYYGRWGYEVKVTDATHARILLHYETGSLPVSEVVGIYEKGEVNKSPAKDIIHWK